MPRIPRDISGDDLIKRLKKLGYQVTRQKGSHIRLTALVNEKEHDITIPNHQAIKIGTLNNILNEISGIFNLTKEKLLEDLF
ncbi:MAG: type II toxin-antitoxin system HicA family toxin [Candidatus Margulisbacteria bacterium]|nr:type II toxin-antitoxin system HicA family toxin [Candidatus Margulisiibacteriota bacterium]